MALALTTEDVAIIKSNGTEAERAEHPSFVWASIALRKKPYALHDRASVLSINPEENAQRPDESYPTLIRSGLSNIQRVQPKLVVGFPCRLRNPFAQGGIRRKPNRG